VHRYGTAQEIANSISLPDLGPGQLHHGHALAIDGCFTASGALVSELFPKIQGDRCRDGSALIPPDN
jgi:hypothetical protein